MTLERKLRKRAVELEGESSESEGGKKRKRLNPARVGDFYLVFSWKVLYY